jgi:hypothetical protein
MEQLDDILHRATAAIGHEYFLLPIHGTDPVYRERVYCYELYHQMRRLWPEHCAFRLNGEVDKGGHPYFRNDRGKPKPDLLVHAPGVGNNHAVIEVKSSRGTAKEIRKDLRTLCRFGNRGYERAIYLVYGVKADIMLARIKRCASEVDMSVPIEVWLHPAVNASASHLFTLIPRR